MKKLLCVLVLMIVTALAVQAHVAQPEWWVVGIGQLNALFNQSVVDTSFANQMAANPNDGLDATFQSMYAGRQDVDNRISAAVRELCDHDPNFCSTIFSKYALRFQGVN